MKQIAFLITGLLSMAVSAQYDYKDSNMIGLIGGVNQTTMFSDGIDIKGGTGWNAGLSVRGNFYNNWDMVYTFQFSENHFKVATSNAIGVPQDVDYTMSGGQISLQASYKIIPRHLSIEFGPALHFQGKLEYERDKKGNIIIGTPLMAEQLRDISKFNASPCVGITGGFLNFRANISYQYGVLNTFEKVNKDYGSHISGHPGVLNANLILYF
ncbi:MAG: hypothetical protein CFE23_04485 [Flavobacterium sp. BFFFF1]|uniref:PorT family protein n=1 Tax=Flavobacterium sp. BFFFF1 TaxID=2015557 RepID=UPI000BDC6F2B|nr:PorT family protein [Flavobacterium sp. BFFFF1]OYU81358.1 MAG: hypothetical protein CFE23_04485 [Flavobacterium sp. BFFFF1]